MAALRARRSGTAVSGNFVAEWFGHRVWSDVDTSDAAVHNQSGCICPFLSNATASEQLCWKTAREYDGPTGVCIISSNSNGPRQDWLACPTRTLDADFTLIAAAVRTTYKPTHDVAVLVLPVTVLHVKEKRDAITKHLAFGGRAFLFSANKIGGEVDLPETETSPGGKVDVSVIEVLRTDTLTGEPSTFGQHMFFEIQTADFHGSPLHAVRKLRKALPASPSENYHAELQADPSIAGEDVEGPNKANIFKRTVYQMILKIQLAEHENCAGFVMVLPLPVWDSWLRHLGNPKIRPMAGGDLVQMVTPADEDTDILPPARAWIFVFDTDRESKESPQPLKVVQRIATTSSALVHYAFQTAAKEAMEQGVVEKFRDVLKERVERGWRGKLRDQQKGNNRQGRTRND